jgi:DNA-binding GntR family transcriptional regulator
MANSGATRAEVVAEQIRQAIRAGVYISGERLVEMTLAARLNVSQNTVRDALRLLETEGWVVKQSRHGVYVRAFARDEVEELYALWSAIESLALRWTMERLTRKDTQRMRLVIQSARKRVLGGELEEATEAIFQFHGLIAELCGRSQTTQMLASLHNRAYLLEIVRQMRAPRRVHLLEERLLLYEKLVSLIEGNHSADAYDLLNYLLRADCETLLPILDTMPARE